jgi:ABC-type sugar transport system substrate-binding protein
MRGIVTVAAMCVVAMLVSACSSSSSLSASSGAKPLGTSSAAASAAGPVTGCKAAVASKVKAELGPVDQTFPSGAVQAAALKGKTVWIVEYSAANPIQQQLASGLEQGASLIGATVRTYDGGATPSGYSAGIQTAIAQHAGGIIISDIDPSLVPEALNEAAAAQIPVVDAFGASPGAPYPAGDVGHITNNPAAVAGAQVDYAIARSGCRTHILYVAVRGLAVEDRLVAAAEADVKAQCPATCQFQTVASAPASVQTQVPQQVEAALQSDPGINFIIAGSDSLVPLIGTAIKAVGNPAAAEVVGLNGTNLQAMKDGGLPYEVADVSYESNKIVSWFMLNAVIAAANGERNPIVLALRTYDASNIHQPVPEAASEAKFKSAWGVGG